MQGYPKEVGRYPLDQSVTSSQNLVFNGKLEMLHKTGILTEKWKSSGYQHELEDGRLEVPAYHRRRLRGAGRGPVPRAVPLVARGAGRRIGATQVRLRIEFVKRTKKY